jgi:hypothetical protein
MKIMGYVTAPQVTVKQYVEGTKNVLPERVILQT